ncbi:hypothetical protein GCM10009551_022450 [Nocardiopsis tropica]|uniref:DUF4446 family protein n=1 Tax=Nocardiopsis tropica TaxID=109330 RepID=UPI003373C447
MFTTLIASLGLIAGLGGLALGGYALNRARALGDETQVLATRTAAVGASGVDPFAVRDVAVLHYDALEEMSGARSFSLALLNGQGDGVVLTSINGRTESRTYAKAVVRGEGRVLLSPEEDRVVRSARLGNGVGALVPAPSAPVDPVGTAAAGAAVAGSDGSGAEPEADSLVTVLSAVEDMDDTDHLDDAEGCDADDRSGDGEGSGQEDGAGIRASVGDAGDGVPEAAARAGRTSGGAGSLKEKVDGSTSARG